MVIDVLERAALVLQLKVVPVLATHEHTDIAVLQLKVMDALEDFRERAVFLEIQPRIIRGL
ncbi:hypothetical protein D3C84_1159240 [compost metagenome]